MTKRTKIFFVVLSFWIILSTLLFCIGYLYPPHAINFDIDRIKGGIFWWSITIINGMFMQFLQKMNISNYLYVIPLGTILSALTVSSIFVLLIEIPKTISKISLWLERRSIIYKGLKKFFTKLRP